MKKIAFVHTGSFFQLVTVKDPAVISRNVTGVYWPEYDGDFGEYDGLYLAARCHPEIIKAKSGQILDFLNQPGKKVYLDGISQVDNWLPGTSETVRGTNFWSWRTGEDLGRRSVNTDHPIWQNYLSDAAVHWHYHGVLDAPETATPLVVLTEIEQTGPGVDPWGHEYYAIPGHPNALMYYDAGTFPAEIIVSTMDASYHHGSGFMPGATQLLYRMLLWLGD